ncbi:MAG: hypothetical protein ACK6CU_17215, partial [Deltaproteobacteria bacterium]
MLFLHAVGRVPQLAPQLLELTLDLLPRLVLAAEALELALALLEQALLLLRRLLAARLALAAPLEQALLLRRGLLERSLARLALPIGGARAQVLVELAGRWLG